MRNVTSYTRFISLTCYKFYVFSFRLQFIFASSPRQNDLPKKSHDCRQSSSHSSKVQCAILLEIKSNDCLLKVSWLIISLVFGPTPTLLKYLQRLFASYEEKVQRRIQCLLIFDGLLKLYSLRWKLIFIKFKFLVIWATYSRNSEFWLTSIFTSFNSILLSNKEFFLPLMWSYDLALVQCKMSVLPWLVCIIVQTQNKRTMYLQFLVLFVCIFGLKIC